MKLKTQTWVDERYKTNIIQEEKLSITNNDLIMQDITANMYNNLDLNNNAVTSIYKDEEYLKSIGFIII